MIELSRRPATYTELRKHAKAEGLGWFSSRFYALLGLLSGTQIVTIGEPDSQP